MKSSLNDFDTIQSHSKGTGLVQRILSNDAALILLAIVLVLALISLSSCAPIAASVQATATATPNATPSPTDNGLPAVPPGKPSFKITPTPGENALPADAPIVAVIEQALASKLGIDVSGITFISGEYVEWPDSCLGFEQPGEMCSQVITPGYRVTLSAGGKLYEAHANLSGKSIRMQ